MKVIVNGRRAESKTGHRGIRERERERERVGEREREGGRERERGRERENGGGRNHVDVAGER